MDPADVEGPSFSDELLYIYYQRLFPYDQMYLWLSYGNFSDKNYFYRREISFTIANDIYIRYQCFKDKDDMKQQIQKMKPHKIDIGAIFTVPPRDHSTVKQGVFRPIERELVFDIDMTDYDDARTCCTGASICQKCWTYMSMAMKVLDASLREDFGFKHILWVYSGRRGVHCWVCDSTARILSNEARSAIAHFLTIVSGGEASSKKVAGLEHPIHFSVQRAFDILEPIFIEKIIGEEGQKLLSDRENWKKLLGTLPYPDLAKDLDATWQSKSVRTPKEKWHEVISEVQNRAEKESRKGKKARIETNATSGTVSGHVWKYHTVFVHGYPRLDINVSTHMNHLLKSPFVAHPKTGRVCVPIDCSSAEKFDPFTVPTLGQLAAEIDSYAGPNLNLPDLEKTSLHSYIRFFETSFLRPLHTEIRKQKRDTSDKEAANNIDF